MPLFGGRMRVVDEEPMETIHLYVVLEDQLLPKRDTASVVKVVLCFVVLLVFISLSLTTHSPDHEVSFELQERYSGMTKKQRASKNLVQLPLMGSVAIYRRVATREHPKRFLISMI